MAKVISLNDGKAIIKFKIEKMPATKAEAWMLHAIALLGSGITGAEDQFSPAMLLSAIGKAPFAESKALLDELLECVQKVNADGTTMQVSLDDADGYISSPLTLLRLRKEVIAENFGFLADGNALGFLGAANS